MWGGVEVGDHVRARRDITSGWTDTLMERPTVRRGRPGIVREIQRGLWSTRYTVEFDDTIGSLTIDDLREEDLRPTGGHGEESWASKRAIRRGVRLGLFCAFTLPALVSLGLYYLHGGTTAELVPAVADEALSMVLWVVGLGLGALGPMLPLVMVVGILVLVVRGRGS